MVSTSSLPEIVLVLVNTDCLSLLLLDNPESDIAGANAAGWNSILVRTGVYDPDQGLPTHIPTREVEDVEEAVRWAIDNEFEKRGKS